MSEEAASLSIFADDKSSITAFFAHPTRRSNVCFVLFSYWAEGERQLHAKVGGTNPLLREGIDVVCVQTNCDDWHQNIYPHGIDRLKSFLNDNYASAKGYGISMGGYAAILYAAKLQLQSVLALSPQFTISEPFDQRWRQYDRQISWRYQMAPNSNYTGTFHIVYDPFDLDAQHAARIKQTFTAAKVMDHEVKYVGHLAANYFHNAGELTNLLLSYARDEITIPTVDRKQNSAYFKALTSRLAKRNKLHCAKAAIEKTIDLGDHSHATYRQASTICLRLQNYEDAAAFARKSLQADDNTDETTASTKEHLANILRLAGDLDAAERIVDDLLQQEADRLSALAVKSKILIAQNQLDEAKATVLSAIALGADGHATYRLASNICRRLKQPKPAVAFAEKAIAAWDNTDTSRARHTEHLENMRRWATNRAARKKAK